MTTTTNQDVAFIPRADERVILVAECSCGESYEGPVEKAGDTIKAAWACKKCRQYLFPDDFAQRRVVAGLFARSGDWTKATYRTLDGQHEARAVCGLPNRYFVDVGSVD